MPPIDLSAADLALIATYALLLFAPGLLIGSAAGLRGWLLVAAAPLVTYATAGLAGPWTAAMGLPWSPAVLAGATIVLAAVMAAVHHGPDLLRRLRALSPSTPRSSLPHWSREAHYGVAVVIVVATLTGAAAILGGIRRISTIPQDWDAVFHANGIRWIAETGDASLFGMSQVNWYENGTGIFYPNAYHLVASSVYQITGRDLPSILNAHTVLIPGLGALVLAVLVQRFGGSAVHAAGTALATVGISAVYDMLWRGPLLPYATGVVLTPVFVVLLAHFLDANSVRDRVAEGMLLALAAAGLLCIHPAMLFGAVVFGLPYLLWRWTRRPQGLRSEPLLLIGVGAVALALSSMQIAGALYSAASFPPVDWPADLSWPESVKEILTFSHASASLQVWPTAAAAVGLLMYPRLGDLRWIVVPAAVFGGLFVLAASSDAAWVNAITRPWWNDRFRLAGIFALTLCILIGNGLAQLHEAAAAVLRVLARRSNIEQSARALTAITSGAVVLGFVVATHMLYLDRNAAKMSINVGDGPAISQGEVAAIEALGRIVPPRTRVLNDRYDGSVWMYALAGVRPVAGHYDATGLGGTDVSLLETGFNRYPDDAAVQAAVARLNVEYVMLGEGFLRQASTRALGLRNLDENPHLRTIYRSTQAVIYQIIPPAMNFP